MAGDALVAGHVVLALFVPELPIGFGARVALGRAVPKTPVNEDCDLFLWEGKVGLSKNRKMPSPAGDLVSLQQAQQRLLGLLVPLPPNERHDFGALFSRPDICHESDLVES